MRIGIIGAGNVGSTLARGLSHAGDEVAIATARGPQHLLGIVDGLGERVYAATLVDAACFAEVVIAAIPFGRYPELPVDALAGRTVVDASNYEPGRDGPWPELDQGLITSSELVQAHLRASRVVKSFNTMRWHRLRDYGRQSSATWRYGMPVSGDDAEAKRVVLDLVEQVGFDPVDVGGLADGGRWQQPGSVIHDADLTGGQLREALRTPVG